MTPTHQDHDKHHQFYTTKPQACSSSSLSSRVFTYPIQDQGGFYHGEVQQLNYQQEENDLASETHEINSDHGIKLCLWNKEEGSENHQNHNQGGSPKWMPSKLRLMRKMLNNSHHRFGSEAPTNYAQKNFEDQNKKASSPLGTDNSSNRSSSNSSIPIRVCSDCNTTKTPLWRSGPRGPKSLCNACGIRQRKARRAMVAAAAAANGTVLAVETPPLKAKGQHKEKKRLNTGNVTKYKKRSKLATNTHGVKKKICFEDFLISLSKNLAFHSVFPQDEKEAAILLMALSCGLVHG